MRLYGALSELAELIIRLASGKTVKVSASEQTAAGETIVTIPNVVDGADEFVMKDTQQSLTKKTLSGSVTTDGFGNKTSDTILTNPDITANKIALPSISNETDRPNDTRVAGALHWRTSDSRMTVGAGSEYRVLVDESSSQTLFLKTLNNSSLSGGSVVGGTIGNPSNPVSIDRISKLQISPGITGTNINQVAITNASGELVTESALAKLRGGFGFNATDITIPNPSSSGAYTVVGDSLSQTLSNKTIGSVSTPANGILTISGTGALQIPAGTTAQKNAIATPVEGMIRYNTDTDSFEGYASNTWSGIGGGGTTDRVPQTAHGFALGDVLWLDPGNPPTIPASYKKARADAANTAEVVGMVSRVIDVDNFELTLSGEVSGLSGLTAGEVYFLSASTAGALTVTEPSVVGQVSLPVGVASSTTSLYVAPKRGVVVGAANARTTIAVSNNSATNVVSVTNYNSLKLEGELNVTRSSGGNQRAYYTVEAAKNGAGVWQVSASYTGDDVLYTTLPSWDVASNNLQVTMPLVTNFTSASLTYSLNAPAVGASLPLSVDSSALNIVSEAPLSYRNRIINGDMRIDQRNAGAAVTVNTAANTYTLDRWQGYGQATDGVFTIQRVTDAPSGFNNSLKVTVTTADASIGASQIYQVSQRIEGYNVADLELGKPTAKTFTASFWVKSSVAGTYSVSFGNNVDRSYPTTYAVNSANTWEYKTVTVVGATDGTWNYENGVGLIVHFDLGTGTSVRGTANTWANYPYAVTGSASLISTNGASLQISGVQLEVGSKASAFERRPYSMELSLAMRYYQTGRFLTTGVGGTIAYLRASSLLPVVMRAQPIFTVFDNAGTAGKVSADATNNITAGISGTTQFFSAGPENYVVPANSYMNGSFTANAEL